MTLPSSPPISLGQVATELGIGLPLSAGDSRVLALADLGGPPISLTNLLGKSNTPSVSCPGINVFVNSSGGATEASGSTAATATGGAGGYSYGFAYVSGDTSITGAGNASTGGFTASTSIGGDNTKTATWEATVTDSQGHTASVQFTIGFEASNTE